MTARSRLVLIVTFAAALLAGTSVVHAQQPGKVFRIGILSNVPLSDAEGARVWGAFIEGLRDLGYVEGQNTTIEHLSSEGKYERLPDLAAELVRRKVDVIVVPTTQNVVAAQQASRTIPIIMAGSGDPVRAGIVASLARPGGNVTGLTLLGPEIAGKQLALLKETLPRLSRVAVLGNPTNQAHAQLLEELKASARSLGIPLHIVEARRPEDFERTFAAVAKEHDGALFVAGDGMFLLHRTRLVELAAKHRLPAMYGMREHVDAGGLMFYGPSMRESFRRAAIYVDKILKGVKPADLPVERPTKFDLIINLKTAKTLELTIPPSVLVRADEVLQ
jgi:putative ABC transport system substrate-binding protein